LIDVRKERVPKRHQPALTNGRESLRDWSEADGIGKACVSPNLDLREVLGPLRDIHPLESDSNGTGRHNGHSVAIVAKLDGSLGNQGKNGEDGLVRLLIHDRAGPWGSESALPTQNTDQGQKAPILMTMVKCFGRCMATPSFDVGSIFKIWESRHFYMAPGFGLRAAPCIDIVFPAQRQGNFCLFCRG